LDVKRKQGCLLEQKQKYGIVAIENRIQVDVAENA